MGKNRIAKYIREIESKPVAKVVVVNDLAGQMVTLSINGEHLVWQWTPEGLLGPGAAKPLEIHPLAAETVVIDEMTEFLGLEGIGPEEVVYVTSAGTKLDGVFLHPVELGEPTYISLIKKEALTILFFTYKDGERKLTETLIGESISHGVLGPFLSLVNMQGW